MAGHPLDYTPFPTVNPTGAPGGDAERIDARPEMFGGLLAQGEEKLGRGIADVANAGIQAFTEKQDLDNSVHAAEVHSWLSDRLTDRQSQFSQLKGRAANDALPQFKADVEDLNKQAIEQAQSPKMKAMLATENRRLIDNMYEIGRRHADTEMGQWRAKTATDASSSFGNQAALYSTNGMWKQADEALFNSAQEVRNWLEPQGYDGKTIETEVAKNYGRNVKTIVETLAKQDQFDKADAVFKKYGDQIDAESRLQIETALHTEREKKKGVAFSEAQLGRSVDPSLRTLEQAGQKYGIYASYLSRTRQIETGNNPNQRSSTGAEGPFQFTKGTAAQYGLTNPYDLEQAADAAARLARDNKSHLTTALGRPPSDSELYLAHQQGWFGAWKLLQNPTARAGDLVGDRAIAVNGGDPNATAAQFAAKWDKRFNAIPAQQALDPKSHADAMAAIMNNPDLSDQAKAAGLAHVTKFFQVENARTVDQERLQRQQDQERKRLSDETENTVLKDLYSDKPVTTVATIVGNDALTREAKERMIGVATRANRGEPLAHVSHDTTVDLISRMRLPAGDPNRITDNKPLYDALIAGKLNKADFDWLQRQQTEARSPDGERLAERKKLFMQGVGPIIDKSDPLSQYTDHAGRLKVYEFEFDLDKKIEQMRRDGKDPFDLFNPAKPEYMGKPEALDPYKKRYGAALEDAAAASGAARPGASAAPVKFDINQVKSLAELQQAYKEHKIEQWQAQQYAIEKGWAGRKLQPGRIPEPADIRQ